MVELAPFNSNDFSDLINWIDNEELLMSWSGGLFSFPLTNSSLSWYIKDTNIPGDSDAFIYKVTNKEGDNIGHISLGSISWKNRSARITRVFISNAQKGNGYCRQMVSAVLKIGVEELKLHRISLGVYTTNTAALKCYQKSGLSIEGTHRDILLHKGVYWSLVEMGMLENEWQTLNSQ